MNQKYTRRTEDQVASFKRWVEEKAAELDTAARNFEQGEDGRAANILKNIASDLMYKMIVLSKAHGIAFQKMLDDTEENV